VSVQVEKSKSKRYCAACSKLADLLEPQRDALGLRVVLEDLYTSPMVETVRLTTETKQFTTWLCGPCAEGLRHSLGDLSWSE